MIDGMLRNETSPMKTDVDVMDDLDAACVTNPVRRGTPEWDELVSSVLDKNREALDILAK